MAKIGIVGCGGIGLRHLAAYEANGVKVSTVADNDKERAKALGEKLDVSWYGSAEEMFDAQDLDGVSICVPPIAHAPISIEALKRNINVICEKPLVRNMEEGYKILEALMDSNAIFMVGFCHRFHPPIIEMKKLIDSGKLGRVELFHNQFSGEMKDLASKWFSSKEIGGGGSIIDTSIHSIDIFRYLVGDISDVSGFGTISISGVEVENTASMLLRSTSGAIGTISASWATPRGAAIVEIYGSEGTCIYDYVTNELKISTREEPQWKVLYHEGPDRFAAEIKEFLECIREGRKPSVNIIDGLKAIEAVQKVYMNDSAISKA